MAESDKKPEEDWVRISPPDKQDVNKDKFKGMIEFIRGDKEKKDAIIRTNQQGKPTTGTRG